jgi:hypothetical protein
MAQTTIQQSSGRRFMVSLPVRAEWDEEKTGNHIVSEGRTENVGPAGALVTLERLPDVSSTIQISVQGRPGSLTKTEAEVVRLYRDPLEPLASLSILNGHEEWRGQVWEPASILAARGPDDEDDDEGGIN